MGSVEIVNDIRLVCLSDNKMTEKERIEIVFNIRPKLKVMNKRLQRLTRAVKYTSMSDIWHEIDEGSREKADKKSIVKECMNRWKRSGRIN
jgi:streptomycin 6-kinase